jgi:hypothetical protein
MTEWCENSPCETEATHAFEDETGVTYFLCMTCRDAFEWGQTLPKAQVISIDKFFEGKTFIAARYISPKEIAEYNDLTHMPKDIHISLNSVCVIREWDEGDGCVLVTSEDFPDEEVWVLQSWLKEV